MTEPVQLPPEAQKLLESMHDIAEPGPISWWPLAPGWWAVIILLVAVVGFAIYWYVQRVRNNRYRKAALQLLASLSNQPSQHSITELNEIIKRTALHAYPQEHAVIARSFGNQWVQWLNSKCKKPVLDDQAAQDLAQGSYRPDGGVLSKNLVDAARNWIVQHTPTQSQSRPSHA